MKILSFFFAVFMYGMVVAAEGPTQEENAAVKSQGLPLINWGLLWTGSWEESVKTLLGDQSTLDNPALSAAFHNRVEIRLHLLSPGILLRGQILDRRPIGLEFTSLRNGFVLEPEKTLTHLTGGLYHRTTGSRLLFGILDEWGLPARIRSPWIRSPPYPENHIPIMADLKTAASSTKENEAYLYVSSPFLNFTSNVKARSFFSIQTEIDTSRAQHSDLAASVGTDLRFTKDSSSLYSFLLETFYTGKTLPPVNTSTWFSYPPALPERKFNLYAVGLLFTSPNFSVSSDFALSETFAWGTDIYANFGVTVTPLLPFGARARPLAVSFAADGSGERYVNRDGNNYSAGFRGAGKIEWRGRYNYLIRINSVLRSPGLGEDFNRSSTGFYCRFPSLPANRNVRFPVRLTRISLTADRNGADTKKINDSYYGSIGLSLNLRNYNLPDLFTGNPIGITFSGSVKGLADSDRASLYPVPIGKWNWESANINCELFWSPGIFQFRTRAGLSMTENEDNWDFSFSTTIRFRQGRLTLRAESPDFPEKWRWNVSWRLEIQEKR